MIGIALVLSLLGGGPLVVHEWGTFTSMQGSAGVDLEGMQHETERLPDFVYSRTSSQESPFRDFGDTSFDETLPGNRHMRNVRGKMETPVIYFHTDCPRRVRVHVDFVGGLLTQWYPRETAATPAFTAGARLDPDLSRIARSSLEWELDLLPFGDAAAAAAALVPTVAKDDSWDLARQVRAATVRTVASAKEMEADRYVFYRGLGRTEQAVRVDAHRNGVALVRNQSAENITAAFALEMGDTDGSFQALGALPAGAVRPVVPATPAAKRLPKAQVIAALEAAVHAALVADGLFADEATAMVRTWSATWFGAEGTRIVYLFPRARIDALIPLTITPAPQKMVRVMVGRLEYLTPESEEALSAALLDRMSTDPRLVASANARLARRGRFLEASVRRVFATHRDPAIQRAAAAVLASY